MSRLEPLTQRPGTRPQSAAGINAAAVEALWGVTAKSKGTGSLGLSAALWDSSRPGVREINRPACDRTHVISIWNRGTANSSLFIDERIRFKRVRARGTFQLARAGESVRAIINNTSGTCLDIYLPAHIVAQSLETECEGGRSGLELLPLRLEDDATITRLGDNIASEIQEPGLASRMALDSATLLLAVNLIRRWSNQAGAVRPPQAGLAPWQVRRTQGFLHDHLAEDVSLAELAALARLSPFHFARAFKKSVGAPPHAYQRGLRIERAKELLAATDLAITEVAARVGYESPQTLARAFQRDLAVTPSRYRRERRA